MYISDKLCLFRDELPRIAHSAIFTSVKCFLHSLFVGLEFHVDKRQWNRLCLCTRQNCFLAGTPHCFLFNVGIYHPILLFSYQILVIGKQQTKKRWNIPCKFSLYGIKLICFMHKNKLVSKIRSAELIFIADFSFNLWGHL